MDPKLKQILQRLHSDFINDTADVQGVIDKLFSAEVFNQNVKNKIESKGTESQKMDELLLVLKKRPDKAMDTFYNVLVEVGEDLLAERLRQALEEIDRVPNKAADRESSSAGVGASAGPSGDQLDRADDDELPPKWPDSAAYDPMRFEVTMVEDSSMKERFEKAIKSGDTIHVYPMYRKRRGILLLLNNHDFSEARKNKVDLSDRTGTQHDQLALDNLFKQLGFHVIIKTDRKAQEMLDAIKEQAKEDHSTFDCFACAVLSHGFCGGFYGVDGAKVILEDFKSAVDGQNCKSLRGKPKIFIIQACQGEARDPGVTQDGPGPAGDTGLENRMQRLELYEENDSKLGVKADFFTAMATVPGYVSWRVPGHTTQFAGSWFVQAVVYVIHKLAHKYDLGRLMTRVNRLVSKAESSHGYKQVCEPRNALRSDFYFFPGLHKNS